MTAPRPSKSAVARELDSWLSAFEARVTIARAKNQIEIHVSLDDAMQLAKLARIVVSMSTRPTAQPMPDRAPCSVCSREYAVNATGRLRRHPGPCGGICRGSGRPTHAELDAQAAMASARLRKGEGAGT